MNTYKVRFVSNSQQHDIQRELLNAESVEELEKMYADNGYRLIDVDIVLSTFEIEAYLAEYETMLADCEARDWAEQMRDERPI